MVEVEDPITEFLVSMKVQVSGREGEENGGGTLMGRLGLRASTLMGRRNNERINHQ